MHAARSLRLHGHITHNRTVTRYQQVLPTGLIHLVLQCRKHDQLLQHLYDEEIKSEIGEGLMCREIFGFLATAFW